MENNNASTVVNRELFSEGTVINPSVADSSATAVNLEMSMMNVQIPAGFVVNGKYVIRERMNKNSGEADLYIAEYRGREYVVKVYRRAEAIKQEVVERLLELDCPNLPKLYEVGMLEQRQYEIMDYYRSGSLTGKTLSFEELQKRLIPDMNNALHILDEVNIVHKDIKPANIMQKEDGTYVLMDFGISSVRDENQSIIRTQTGLTPEYMAPELAYKLFSNSSDYYALGISIYQLFLGKLPFEGMTAEESNAFRMAKGLHIPAEVPERLKELIHGLTQMEREDRWKYAQVNDWLAGKQTAVKNSSQNPPKEKVIVMSEQTDAYDFVDGVYTNVDSLILAMAKHWEDGKKHLFRGFLQEHFRNNRMRNNASICADAEMNPTDISYMQFLYKISDKLDGIYWKGKEWTIEAYAKELLRKLWSCMGNYSMDRLGEFKELLEVEVLENFLAMKIKADAQNPRWEMLRTECDKVKSASGRGKYEALYYLAYCILENAILYVDQRHFTSYETFLQSVAEKYNEGEEQLIPYLKVLGFENGKSVNPDVQIAAFKNYISAHNA